MGPCKNIMARPQVAGRGDGLQIWRVAANILNKQSRTAGGLQLGVWDGAESETWSLTLRKEHRLRVFENAVLRRICQPRRDEVKEKWRKMHSEELHILYSSPNIIRLIKSSRMMWAGHVERKGEERQVHKFTMVIFVAFYSKLKNNILFGRIV
jgi:hypothetical protein